MKKLSPLVAIFLAVFLVANGFASPSRADSLPDEQWVISTPTPSPQTTSYYGVMANGSQDVFGVGTSMLLGQDSDGTVIHSSPVTGTHRCKSLTDSACSKVNLYRYYATLPICSNTVTMDCISSIEAKNASGNALTVNLSGSYPVTAPDAFTGDPTASLPNGSSPVLVDIPDAPHPGGTKYLVIVSAQGERGPGAQKFQTDKFEADIYAVKVAPTARPFNPVNISMSLVDQPRLGEFNISTIDPGSTPCAAYDSSSCAYKYPLPLNISFTINIKTSMNLAGWFHGRISNANASITTDLNGYQDISLTGNPVVLPNLFGWIKKSDAPSDLVNAIESGPYMGQGMGYGCKDDPNFVNPHPCLANQWISELREPGFDEPSMDEFLAWLKVLNDKANIAPTHWVVASMQGDNGNTCLNSNSEVNGIVSTNSTVYLSGPPSFNSTTGTLDYKVAAPHYLPDGSEFLGSYNLQIRSSVARCLYGFSSAPVKATVSIIAADGTNKVATTVVDEREGWLYLQANGFTFSNPTIKVKLSQDAPTPVATPTPVASESPAPAPVVTKAPAVAKKITITCVKGKSIKSVMAVKPTCPAGYKRK